MPPCPTYGAPEVALSETTPPVQEANPTPTANEAHTLPFTVPPPLAGIAILFALYDLVMTRVALRLSGVEWEVMTRLQWSRWGAFARNLTGVAGLVALTFIIVRFAQDRRFAPYPRRMLLLLFASIAWFTIGASVLLPQDSFQPKFVLIALGAGNVFAVLTSLEALRWPCPRGVRLGLLTWTLGLFASFTSLVLALAGASTGWQSGLSLAGHLRDIGEVAFLSTAPILGTCFLLDERRPVKLAVGAVAAVVLGIPLSMLLNLPSSEYTVLIYGAQRLSLFLDHSPYIYLFTLPLFFASAVATVLSRDPHRRSVGAALLAFFCCGYGPSSPITILMMVLGTVMLAQGIVGMAWQTHMRQLTQRAASSDSEAPDAERTSDEAVDPA